jgi:hypothetical protein
MDITCIEEFNVIVTGSSDACPYEMAWDDTTKVRGLHFSER